MHTGVKGLLASAVVLAAASVVACSGSKDNSNDPLTVGGSSETVVMSDNEYAPGNLQVPAGATITFTNEGNAVHDAVDGEERWETGNLKGGESETLSFDTPGEYAYKCTFHPGMKARITVVGT